MHKIKFTITLLFLFFYTITNSQTCIKSFSINLKLNVDNDKNIPQFVEYNYLDKWNRMTSGYFYGSRIRKMEIDSILNKSIHYRYFFDFKTCNEPSFIIYEIEFGKKKCFLVFNFDAFNTRRAYKMDFDNSITINLKNNSFQVIEMIIDSTGSKYQLELKEVTEKYYEKKKKQLKRYFSNNGERSSIGQKRLAKH